MRFFFAVLGAGLFTMTQVAACGSDGPTGFDGGGTDAGGTDATSCGAGQTLCSGQCSDTSSDVYNCGTCGNACAGGEACCAGYCVKTTCSFSVTGEPNAKGRDKNADGIDTLIGVYYEGDTFYQITVYGTGKLPHKDLSNLMNAEHDRLAHG